MKMQILSMALAAVLASSGSAAAQVDQIIRRNSDVFHEVAGRVNQYVHFSVFDDVAASVEDGIVTLTGHVTMPYKRDDLTRIVSRVNGVREVQNRIEVLPASTFDDDLRFRVARAIYGNPAFWHYANMANPPIHIIVNRGHVTLTGVVNSNVERVLARSLATGFGEFSVSNELKTDAEMQQQLARIR
ncbi:MAG TPA: BON domain-containing protein [Vicinamibacterales bacterium]